MDDIHNTIENYRIKTACGSNETNGVYLKVKYELQENGSDVGVPMEFYTGNEYEDGGIKIEREKMKEFMKNYKIPDDEVEKLFGIGTTSAETDNDGAVTTTEAILTENASLPQSILFETSTGFDNGDAVTTSEASLTEKTSMPQPTFSGTTSNGTDSGGAVTTTAVLAGNAPESQEKKDKGTMAAGQEFKVETNKTIKNRIKHQKAKEKAKAKANQAKESGSKATVENTSADGSAEADTDFLVDAATPGECLRCGELAKKICAKCQKNSNQKSYYCSLECWNEHLSVHEQICSLVKPQKKYPNSSVYSVDQFKSVYGIFLAEDTKPSIVDVKIERKWSPTTFRHFYSVDSKEFLGKIGYRTYITDNTLKPNRAVPNYFTVFYLPEESLEPRWNEYVQIISGREVADDWNGPILIVKSHGNDLTNFNPIDFELSDDFIDIIDYFKDQFKLYEINELK